MSPPINVPFESEGSFSFHTYRATKRGPGTDDDRIGDIGVPMVIQELRGLVNDYSDDAEHPYLRALQRRADELQAWLDARAGHDERRFGAEGHDEWCPRGESSRHRCTCRAALR